MRKELHQLGERIATQAAHVDAAMHRLLADIREFDAKEGWRLEGAVSCAHWLAWRVGWDLATARDRVRVARRLGELPHIDDALRRGVISYSKARAMVRVATDATEDTLLAYAQHATASQLEKICRKYQAIQRAAGRERDDEPPRRYISRETLDDGMNRVVCVLRPEEAELLFHAMRKAAAEVSPERRDLVDGLMAIVQAAARGTPMKTPVEVVMTVPAAALVQGQASGELGEIGQAEHVSAETARRLSCDAGLVKMVEDASGKAVSVGRRTRTIPAAIKRALMRRDGTCRFPGCSNRTYLDGHHVKHWAKGGETKLDNLISLCTYHHQLVHERGFRVVLDARQQPTFYNPHGREVRATPPRPRTRDLDTRDLDTPAGPAATRDLERPTGPAAPRDLDRPTGPAAPRDLDTPTGPAAPRDHDLDIDARTDVGRSDGIPVDQGRAVDGRERAPGLPLRMSRADRATVDRRRRKEPPHARTTRVVASRRVGRRDPKVVRRARAQRTRRAA